MLIGLLSLWMHTGAVHANTIASHPPQPSVRQDVVAVNDDPRTVRVLILGSSVAHGWKDNPQEGGFLQRCFNAMSELTPVTFDVTDKAVPGHGVLTIRAHYADWLTTYKPDIVVLGWGGLSDLAQKTPLQVFDEQIRWQIAEALHHGAQVYVVTAPVSEASYTTYKSAQATLFQHEIRVAQDFHSPRVHIFNVFDQMKQYLTAHHETVRPYAGDGWHPNAAGHALAAQILLRSLMPNFDSP